MATRREQLLERAARPEEPTRFGSNTRRNTYGKEEEVDDEEEEYDKEDRRGERPNKNANFIKQMKKFLTVLDRNLLVTEDARLFFDSLDAAAEIMVRTMHDPLLPEPSEAAYENLFIDTVRMHANLPDIKVSHTSRSRGLSYAEDYGLRQHIADLQKYVDETTSEEGLLEAIRTMRTSKESATRKTGHSDSNRLRAAFYSAKIEIEKLIGDDHPMLSTILGDDIKRSNRRHISAEEIEAVAKAVAPHIDARGNVRLVVPASTKARTHSQRFLNYNSRSAWYESNAAQSTDSIARLLVELMQKYVQRYRDERCPVRRPSLLDIAKLGGLNPRTFFDVWAWRHANLNSGKEKLLKTYAHAMKACLINDRIKTFKGWGNQQEVMFNLFWAHVTRLSEKARLNGDEDVDERPAVQHFIYDSSIPEPEPPFSPSVVRPFPMRKPAMFGPNKGPTKTFTNTDGRRAWSTPPLNEWALGDDLDDEDDEDAEYDDDVEGLDEVVSDDEALGIDRETLDEDLDFNFEVDDWFEPNEIKALTEEMSKEHKRYLKDAGINEDPTMNVDLKPLEMYLVSCIGRGVK